MTIENTICELRFSEITLEFLPGTTIKSAAWQAVQIARAANKYISHDVWDQATMVKMLFNGIVIQVGPNDVLEAIVAEYDRMAGNV